jgi:hypothetical protein
MCVMNFLLVFVMFKSIPQSHFQFTYLYFAEKVKVFQNQNIENFGVV